MGSGSWAAQRARAEPASGSTGGVLGGVLVTWGAALSACYLCVPSDRPCRIRSDTPASLSLITCPLTHSVTQPLTHSPLLYPAHPLIHSFITQSCMSSFHHSFTHSLIHSLIH